MITFKAGKYQARLAELTTGECMVSTYERTDEGQLRHTHCKVYPAEVLDLQDEWRMVCKFLTLASIQDALSALRGGEVAKA